MEGTIDFNKRNLEKNFFSKQPSIIDLFEFINETDIVIDNLSMNLWSMRQVNINFTYWIAFHSLYDSCNRILWSIEECIKIGNLSDAIMLVRKYKDDLLFYLYSTLNTFDYINSTIWNTKPDVKKRKEIDKWMKNNRNSFNISKAIDYFSEDERLKDFLIKFDIINRYKKLNRNLNNFTHSNGFDYINYPANFYKNNPDKMDSTCTIIKETIQFFSILFIALQSIINPSSISASDYIDSLDMGLEPENGSQYWVAPFIQKYFKNNEKILGNGLIDYLNNLTPMEFK